MTFTIVLILPYTCHGNSPLVPISTHHGINIDSLHLNERGGALATRKKHWKDYRKGNTLPYGELGTSESSASTVITSIALEPAEKYTVKDVTLTGRNTKRGQLDGLTPTAIACESYYPSCGDVCSML